MLTADDKNEVRRIVWRTLAECGLVEPLADSVIDDDYMRPVFGMRAIAGLAEKLPELKRMRAQSNAHWERISQEIAGGIEND